MHESYICKYTHKRASRYEHKARKQMFTQTHGAALMLGKDRPAAGKVRALLCEAGDVTVRTHATATAIFHPGSSVWMVHTTGSGMWDHSGLRASSAALSRLMGGLGAGCGRTAMCLAQHTSQVTHTLCAGIQRPRLPLYSIHTIRVAHHHLLRFLGLMLGVPLIYMRQK
jgi:hypothetical protein